MTQAITVTKMGAARRQLQTALELWFSDGDPVSIHTLAAAAYQLIHDINHHAKGAPLIFDSDFIRKEKRREFVSIVKNASNFFKHADRGKAAQQKSVELHPFSNDYFLIEAIQGLRQLKETLTSHEITFDLWQRIHRPELFSDAWIQDLESGIVIDPATLKSLRALKRNEFLKRCINAPHRKP